MFQFYSIAVGIDTLLQRSELNQKKYAKAPKHFLNSKNKETSVTELILKSCLLLKDRELAIVILT